MSKSVLDDFEQVTYCDLVEKLISFFMVPPSVVCYGHESMLKNVTYHGLLTSKNLAKIMKLLDFQYQKMQKGYQVFKERGMMASLNYLSETFNATMAQVLRATGLTVKDIEEEDCEELVGNSFQYCLSKFAEFRKKIPC